jgi:hypothetical protein
MLSVNTNIGVVIKAKLEQIQALKNNPDPILRTVAMAILPEMKRRVHVDGKDSSGNQIGKYSSGYMVVRTGNYRDAAKNVKGEKVGQFKEKKKAGEAGKYVDRIRLSNKEYGTFTGYVKTGTNRPVYNRTTDTKVILSLTRQMENDMNVVPSGNGYGIVYLNPDNYKKAIWCEATYNKKILTKLTKEEIELAKQTAIEFLPEYLKTI